MKTLHHMQRHPLTPIALALACLAGPAMAGTWVFTGDADFDKGTLTGVNHAAPNANQLQLNITGTSFPVLWIANAGEDTLSKIDSTQTATGPGTEVGRFRTWFNAGAHAHDAWGGPAPSRTAVDKDGNAYVLDRWFGGYPTLFKLLNNSFVDRNGNSVVDTSTGGPATMKPLVDLNGNGLIDDNELQDERIAWARRVPDGIGGPLRSNGIGRALCIGTDGNLWVGLYNNSEYYKVSAVDGHTMAGPVATGYPSYGCLIDQNGTLWGASWGSNVLVRIANTGNNAGPYPVNHVSVPQVYGLALRRGADNKTHVIMGGSCNSYVEYVDQGPVNPVGTAYTTPAALNYCSYAVGTDNDGNITISKTSGGVTKFAPDGKVLWDKGSQVGSSDSRGVIADANNNIWQVHRATHNMAKYKGDNGDFMGVLPVGYEPYTYSDASGTAALSITTKTGHWAVVQDGGAAGTPWSTVSWNATVPSGAGLVTEVRAADAAGDLAAKPFQPAGSGVALSGQTGRFLEVRVTLNANPQNESPVLYDLTVKSASTSCDVNGSGTVDTTDINLIRAAIGQMPTANDPRDANGDGKITILDARACVLKCTNTNCAP